RYGFIGEFPAVSNRALVTRLTALPLTTTHPTRSSCLRPPHPNARLGILGHARAHRFRTRPALPSAPRPPARPPPRAQIPSPNLCPCHRVADGPRRPARINGRLRSGGGAADARGLSGYLVRRCRCPRIVRAVRLFLQKHHTMQKSPLAAVRKR